ncbi:MAG: hypothetical protein H6667_10270 [Ardenticatenaceae bacterium]|nr:hypothetical protein [Ardenticatenaceae bacterium]MCB9446427.1 hypothetical protein [Ardenticatenaceae bacterium]
MPSPLNMCLRCGTAVTMHAIHEQFDTSVYGFVATRGMKQTAGMQQRWVSCLLVVECPPVSRYLLRVTAVSINSIYTVPGNNSIRPLL